MVNIIKTNYGIASRCGDVISINRRLDNYPELKKAIIDHELDHSPTYNLKDITMEFSIPQLSGLKWAYYTFIFTNPSCWTEYLPFWIENKELKISPNILMFWLAVIVFFWLIFKLI